MVQATIRNTTLTLPQSCPDQSLPELLPNQEGEPELELPGLPSQEGGQLWNSLDLYDLGVQFHISRAVSARLYGATNINCDVDARRVLWAPHRSTCG